MIITGGDGGSGHAGGEGNGDGVIALVGSTPLSSNGTEILVLNICSKFPDWVFIEQICFAFELGWGGVNPQKGHWDRVMGVIALAEWLQVAENGNGPACLSGQNLAVTVGRHLPA